MTYLPLACLPEMVARGRGTIVNMVSTDAMPNLSAYIASKQAILAFSQSLAGEVGALGVRVVPFAPGFVDTPGLREAARGLAPQFGLTEDGFMQLPIHPAYPGAMPAGHAAAATAYLVVKLAGEYQGEAVTGYTVLERAGFIQPGDSSGQSIQVQPAERQPTKRAGQEEALRQALGLSQQLGEILAESEAEINRFPVFIRPMARAGFKGKSGQSLQDWKHEQETLTSLLEGLKNGENTNLEPIKAGYPRFKDRLERLLIYYQEAPGEMKRFVKEEAVLNEAARVADWRVQQIRALLAAMEILLNR